MPKKKTALLDPDALTLYSVPWSGDPAEDRIHFLGGSDMGTILGINPYKSPYRLWLEKTGRLVPDDISDTIPVMVGHLCEEAVAQLYTHETGNKVEEALVSFMCKEYPFLKGHVDRLCSDLPDRGLECKTTSHHNKYNYLKGEVPPYYYAQCQFYMMMTGRKHWDLSTLRDNNEFFVNPTSYDRNYCAIMLTAAVHFWNYNVLGDNPPPIDGSESTKEAINKLYPHASSKQTVDLESAESIIDERENAVQQIKSWTKIKNRCDSTLKDMLGDHEAGESGRYYVTYRNSKGTIDMVKVKDLIGREKLEECRKPEGARMLNIVEKEEAK